MSWNKYYIFVDNQPNLDLDKLLPKLGLNNYKTKGIVNLYQTNKPETLFVGHHNKCLIFCHPHLPYIFFGEQASTEERRFVDCFSNSEILVMIEDGTVGGFGFCLIKNGEKIRMKDGCDGEIYNDFGTPLPEETESYEDFKATSGEFEKAEIIENEGEDGYETYLSFQAAWDVPNRLTKKYLGNYIDYIDGDKIMFTRYEEIG